MKRFELLAHSVLLVHHVCCALYSNFCVDYKSSEDVVVRDMSRYRFRYLTTWNFTIQCFYLLMVTVQDILRILPQNKKCIHFQKFIHHVRGYVYTTLVFPTGLLVAGMFWTVWNIDRELVFPKVIDEVLPTWVNHSIHTNILFLLLVESFIYKRVPSFRRAAIGGSIFSVAYCLTFFFTYYQSSRWLYNIFGLLSWPEKMLFMFATYLVSLILIKVGMLLQTLVHTSNYSPDHRLISKKLL